MSEYEADKSPGAMVAAARRQRGWTLDDMSERTKIPSSMLAALEADEFHRLSGPLYARSFLRSCAKELGLPVEEVLALLDRQDGEAPRPAVTPVQRPESVKIKRLGVPWGRIVAGAVVVCGLALAAVLLMKNDGDGQEPAKLQADTASLATVADIPAGGNPAAGAGGVSVAATAGDNPAGSAGGLDFEGGSTWPLVVKLVAAAPVPLSVQKDGEAAFTEVAWATAAFDTLPAAGVESGRAYAMAGGGAVVCWGAVSRVSLRLGTVQGVALTVNGRPRVLVAPPGGGEVTVDLTAVEPPALP